MQQLTELQTLMAQLEAVQNDLEETQPSKQNEATGESNNSNNNNNNNARSSEHLEKLRKMFQERGLVLSEEEFKNLMATKEGQEMAAGIEQMNLLQQTIFLQKEQLQDQERQQTALKQKATYLRSQLAESGRNVDSDGKVIEENNMKVSTPVSKGVVREVQGTPDNRISSENDMYASQLRLILERQGLNLSDEDFAHVMQTDRGQQLLQKVKAVAESPNGKQLNAFITNKDGQSQAKAVTSTSQGTNADINDSGGTPAQEIAIMQNLLRREGINLGEEQVKLLVKSEEGKSLITKLQRLAPTDMKNLNASEGDSSGGGNPTTSTSTSNNNGNGNSNSKTVETSK